MVALLASRRTPLPVQWGSWTVAVLLHLLLVWGWKMPEETLVMPAQQIVEVSLMASAEPEKPRPVTKDTPPLRKAAIAPKTAVAPSQKQAAVVPEVVAGQTTATEGKAQNAVHTEAAPTKATQGAYTQPVYDAAYLRNPAPVYPASAKRRRLEGEVWLKVALSPDGQPQTVEIATSSGHEILDDAARNAVLRWRFVPAERGGVPVAAEVRVPVAFRME